VSTGPRHNASAVAGAAAGAGGTAINGATAIDGSTTVVGIIGHPVAHSLSPAIHNAAFAALRLNMVYVPLPVLEARVLEAVAGLRALGFRGANVTMPYKAAVMPGLDEVSAEARLIDAVNTIVVDGDTLRGFNTDIDGFVLALRQVEPGSLTGLRALVLGAGGALTIADRTPAAAERLVALLRPAYPGVDYRVVALDALTPEAVREARLIVNATSLGMAEASPGSGGAPAAERHEALKVPGVLVDTLRRDHIVYDVVYGKRPTLLLTKARAVGARTIDGLSMLVWQAASAFELWTGAAAPLDVMRSAATRR
jgi:shikimate dehydrogenase